MCSARAISQVLALRFRPCSDALPAKRLRGRPEDDFRGRAARDPTMDADIGAITPPAYRRRPRAAATRPRRLEVQTGTAVAPWQSPGPKSRHGRNGRAGLRHRGL